MIYTIMTTKDRLKEFVLYLDMGQNAFEKEVGIANGYLASKSKSISSDTIEKVLMRYPDINLKWLFTGKGSMLKSSYEKLDIDFQDEQVQDSSLLRVLVKSLESYQKHEDDLLNAMEILKKENHKLKEEINKRKIG